MSKEVLLTESEFDQTIAQSELPILVDFWAPWCAPCHFVGPIVSQIAEERKESLMIGKLNVDENPNIARRYGISGIPTLILFKNGKPVERIVGALPKEMLEQALEPHLK